MKLRILPSSGQSRNNIRRAKRHEEVSVWVLYRVVPSVFRGNEVPLHSMENKFARNISNEDLALLPLCAFGGEIVVVDDAGAIDAACEDLLSWGTIGFDTETRPTFRPGALNRVALLQLSTPERSYLFRLCRIPLAKPIIKVLESDRTLKIGADIRNDIKALQELRHFRPKGFADLQGIVAEWGIADKSVRKMAGLVLGSRVSKAQRLSNWEAAALTPAQQMYAATDAWVCERMYDILMRTEKCPLPLPESIRDQESLEAGNGAPKRKENKNRHKRFRKPKVAADTGDMPEKQNK